MESLDGWPQWVIIGVLWLIAAIEFYILYVRHERMSNLKNKIFRKMKIEGNKIILEKGDKFTVEVQETAAAAATVTNPVVQTPSAKPGQVIAINLAIKNTRSKDVVIDNKVNFVLANPDRNGFYYGGEKGKPYLGAYNREAYFFDGSYKAKSVTIPAGQTVTKKVVFSQTVDVVHCNGGKQLYDSNLVCGLGGRNLVPESYVKSAAWSTSRGATNVLLYVDNNSNVVVPKCLSGDIAFEDGKTYVLEI